MAESAGTTGNVTVSGFIGDINITPPHLVNFTEELTSGRQPGTSLNPKNNTYPYLTIYLNSTSNSPFYLYINATNLHAASSAGYQIPVTNISVNTSCNATGGEPYTLHRLDTSLVAICTDTVGQAVPAYMSANVYFYIDIPHGMYNDTYTGNITIWVNYTAGVGNATWFGIYNTTVTVRKYIEATWNETASPISFGTLAPGSMSNATDETFPTSLISGTGTNVFIDWYINGTDLVNDTYAYKILAANLTYSNATSYETWPANLTTLNNTLPADPTDWGSTSGDWPNWGNRGNNSDTWVFFNITIVPGQQPGLYKGNLTGRAVELDEDPT